MLTVDERLAVQRFAGLKELTVAVASHRHGIEAEHAVERDKAMACFPAHHAHPPVWCDKLLASAIGTLVIEFEEEHAVLHEAPSARRHHLVARHLGPGGGRSKKPHDQERQHSQTTTGRHRILRGYC